MKVIKIIQIIRVKDQNPDQADDQECDQYYVQDNGWHYFQDDDQYYNQDGGQYDIGDNQYMMELDLCTAEDATKRKPLL